MSKLKVDETVCNNFGENPLHLAAAGGTQTFKNYIYFLDIIYIYILNFIIPDKFYYVSLQETL